MYVGRRPFFNNLYAKAVSRSQDGNYLPGPAVMTSEYTVAAPHKIKQDVTSFRVWQGTGTRVRSRFY